MHFTNLDVDFLSQRITWFFGDSFDLLYLAVTKWPTDVFGRLCAKLLPNMDFSHVAFHALQSEVRDKLIAEKPGFYTIHRRYLHDIGTVCCHTSRPMQLFISVSSPKTLINISDDDQVVAVNIDKTVETKSWPVRVQVKWLNVERNGQQTFTGTVNVQALSQQEAEALIQDYIQRKVAVPDVDWGRFGEDTFESYTIKLCEDGWHCEYDSFCVVKERAEL